MDKSSERQARKSRGITRTAGHGAAIVALLAVTGLSGAAVQAMTPAPSGAAQLAGPAQAGAL